MIAHLDKDHSVQVRPDLLDQLLESSRVALLAARNQFGRDVLKGH
jgi:hypothetical protein